MNVDKNIVMIPNAIDCEKYFDKTRSDEFSATLGVNKNRKLILFLGRIHKRKGLKFLIKAFSELKKEIIDILLIIAGPDENYKEILEKLVKELNLDKDVIFLGHIDPVFAYQGSNILVYPATYEIFGLVPFEALLCGTPVIVTDDCGCGEIIKEHKCGYLVSYGDTHDLKEKMKLLIVNPEEGINMVKRGREYILRNLTWERIIEDVIDVYNRSIREYVQ